VSAVDSGSAFRLLPVVADSPWRGLVDRCLAPTEPSETRRHTDVSSHGRPKAPLRDGDTPENAPCGGQFEGRYFMAVMGPCMSRPRATSSIGDAHSMRLCVGKRARLPTARFSGTRQTRINGRRIDSPRQTDTAAIRWGALHTAYLAGARRWRFIVSCLHHAWRRFGRYRCDEAAWLLEVNPWYRAWFRFSGEEGSMAQRRGGPIPAKASLGEEMGGWATWACSRYRGHGPETCVPFMSRVLGRHPRANGRQRVFPLQTGENPAVQALGPNSR
jgi:hypothetical protein